MCEFTVYVVDANLQDRKIVAKNILAAKVKEGKIVMLDAFGGSQPVGDVTIHEVNTLKQELILKKIE
nr:CooT family nickel-binding protein [uncultured Methanospirillum sp.]